MDKILDFRSGRGGWEFIERRCNQMDFAQIFRLTSGFAKQPSRNNVGANLCSCCPSEANSTRQAYKQASTTGKPVNG